MTKAELIERVQESRGELSKREVGDLVDAVFGTLARAIKRDKRFVMPGFGTFSVGGGMELLSTHRTTVRLGYRFHHLSNGYTGHTNPGIDSQIIEIGFALRNPFGRGK